MEYRAFGSSGRRVSALGFGCMRLPTTDNQPVSENIDEDEAVAMIRRAADGGVDYIDTAYPYHGGRSEVVLGKALSGGYRERVKIATKSPVWMIREAKEFDDCLGQQLNKLRDGHIDYYLFHGLTGKRWDTLLAQGLLERAEAAVRDGRIGAVGFSFHDHLASFKKIVDGYGDWALAQIQYNYMDIENQAGTEGLRYAAARGIPVVVMEPLLGGCLARPPRPVMELFEAAGTGRTPAGLALQWLWDQPVVSTVLSGMSDMRQVEENLAAASSSASPLTPDERALVERVRALLLERRAVPCTGCGYCMPCPGGVNIPGLMELLNYGVTYDGMRSSRVRYKRFFPAEERADLCTGCGECEERCPQSIRISEWMPRIHAILAEGKPCAKE